MKKAKSHKETHVANTKFGSGDYYGTAIKNPVGRIIDSQLDYSSVSPKKLKKPPKSLA